jgi:hypothetical protein
MVYSHPWLPGHYSEGRIIAHLRARPSCGTILSMSDSAENLIGKPLVVYVDGERREVGTITNAKTEGDKLFIAGKLTEPVAGLEGEIFKELHEDA